MTFSSVVLKPVQRLLGQAVNQVYAHRLETVCARRLDDAQCFFFALDAVHRLLHFGVEILHADADAVEAQPGEQGDGLVADLARVDLDGIFAVLDQREILGDRPPSACAFRSSLRKVGVPPPKCNCSRRPSPGISSPAFPFP